MSKHGRIMTAFVFAVPPLAWRGSAFYQKLPQLLPEKSATALPSLSIIVPARNEAPNLRRLLPSLQQLDYPGAVEIIVVDDQSSDDTAVVAQAHGARVIPIVELLPGWLGKPHASHMGALAAQGEWLLFTDADTRHNPLSAATAMNYARQHQLDGISLFLQQETRGWLDDSALMVAFAGLFAGMKTGAPVLNGQYILLNRQRYLESGGFAAVRNEMLEDLAYGRLLQQKGYRVPILRGEKLAQVFMYASRGQMWRGIMRLGSGSLRWSGVGALLTAVFITGVMSPVLAPLLTLTHRLKRRTLLLYWAVVWLSLWPWTRLMRPGWHALLTPIGAVTIQIAATYGVIRRRLGRGLTWKNRTV